MKTIIIACEAGMGSQPMTVNSLKKKLKKAGVADVKVIHKPAREIPGNAPLVVVHEGLSKVARKKAPDAVVVTFKQFLNDPAFEMLVNAFSNGETIASSVE